MKTTSTVLCPNDWEIRRFFLFIGAIQLGLIGSLAIDSGNSFFLINKILLGFFYVVVIPGALVLRSLRLHNLGTSKTIIYLVTLSLAFDLILGLIANSLLPHLGVSRPLSALPLAVTFGVTILLFSLLAYFRDKKYSTQVSHQLGISIISRVLFFLLLPLLAILGAELVNSENNNIVLMALIPLLAIIPLLALSSKLIPEQLYPLAITTVALSLMLHISLISQHIFGRDILVEYRTFQVTEAQSLWTSTYPYHGYNSTLSITILPVVISRFTGLDGLNILKVVIPAFFSLTPLIMYEIVSRFLERKIALLTAFLPMFLYQFYFVMPQTAKSEMGWLFMSGALLALVSQGKAFEKTILVLVFLLAGVFSHYFSAYLACYIFITAALLLYLFRLLRARASERSLILNIALLLVVVTLVWYMYTTASANFRVFIWVIGDFAKAFTSGFTSPTGAYVITLVGREELSPARFVLKYQYLVLYALIILGFAIYFVRLVRRKRIEFSLEFMAFSSAAVILLLAAILPGAGATMDINRSFSLVMIFLAPFAAAGMFILVTLLYRALPILRGSIKKGILSLKEAVLSDYQWNIWQSSRGIRLAALASLAIFIGAFLLFGSGWASEVEKDDYPLSWALSRTRINFPVYYSVELDGTEWLFAHRDKGKEIYYDDSAEMSFLYYTPLKELKDGLYAIGRRFALYQETPEELGARPVVVPEGLEADSYIYLRAINLNSQELAVVVIVHRLLDVPKVVPLESLPTFSRAINEASIIFNNGGSEVRLMQ